jgi:hypothetical protein
LAVVDAQAQQWVKAHNIQIKGASFIKELTAF